MNTGYKADTASEDHAASAPSTRIALWWLRNYEEIIHFWTGFSWLWVLGVILAAIVGYLDLSYALAIILCFGIIASAGAYLAVRAVGSHLKHLSDGPLKDEAHNLMVEIIRRRMA